VADGGVKNLLQVVTSVRVVVEKAKDGMVEGHRSFILYNICPIYYKSNIVFLQDSVKNEMSDEGKTKKTGLVMLRSFLFVM
jgi:uncharacterized protein YqkB